MLKLRTILFPVALSALTAALLVIFVEQDLAAEYLAIEKASAERKEKEAGIRTAAILGAAIATRDRQIGPAFYSDAIRAVRLIHAGRSAEALLLVSRDK